MYTCSKNGKREMYPDKCTPSEKRKVIVVLFQKTSYLSSRSDMKTIFQSRSSLTSLNLSNFNTNNVKDIQYMFNEGSSLTSLNLSNFNTSNVTDMSYMFQSCGSLSLKF